MSLKTKTIILSLVITVAVLAIVLGFFFWSGKGFSPRLAGGQDFLQSPFDSKELYDDIFSGLPESSPNSDIKAGIVSHHFLAREMIAELYNQISNQDVKTVFLVSPDHYNNFFQTGIRAYTSTLPWKTPFDDFYAQKDYADRLVANGDVQMNDLAVGSEHGIYIEMPFLRKCFPGAKLVPLVVKSTAQYDGFFALGKEINEIADDKTIMIISSDFSHNVSADVASSQDEESIVVLNNLSLDGLNDVESDCRACLAVLSGFLDGQDYDFSLISNKNSLDFSGTNQGKEGGVTSYISGYYIRKK